MTLSISTSFMSNLVFFARIASVELLLPDNDANVDLADFSFLVAILDVKF